MKINSIKIVTLFMSFGLVSFLSPISLMGEYSKSFTSFKDIEAISHFQRKITNFIQVKVEGLPTIAEVENTLLVGNKDFSKVYYQGTHRMSENVNFDIQLPASVDSIYFKFGNIEKVFVNEGDQLNLNYSI